MVLDGNRTGLDGNGIRMGGDRSPHGRGLRGFAEARMNALGAVSVSIAGLVDAVGYGTKMQVVFIRKAE